MTSRYLKRRFSYTNLEIGQNGIGNRICKQQKLVAYYVKYKRKKKNFANENGKLYLFFLYLFFLLI